MNRPGQSKRHRLGRSTRAWIAITLAWPALALAQDAARGRELFVQCAACHSLQPPSTADGPALAGVIGRASGSVADFRYSRPMSRAGLTWDEATLDRYLAEPQAVVPGTRMAFSGLAQAQDRADLIAYLKEQK